MNRNSIPLNALVKMWPTPSICGNYNRKGASATSGDGLATAVRNWPTPSAEDHKTDGPKVLSRMFTAEMKTSDQRLRNFVAAGNGGLLNPSWVCWLMGWPIGWTSLDPLNDILWLDWSVDPADMEKPEMWPTHKAGICGMTAVCSDRPPEKSTHLTMQVHLRGRTGTGPIPRVATGIKDRVNRLKALGNGQVPLSVSTAWKILSVSEWSINPENRK